MTTQTPPTEERLSRLEGAYEQLSERLNEPVRGLADLRTDMNARLSAMNERIDDLARGQAALRADVNALRSNMDQRLDSFRSEMNSRLSEMNSRLNVMIVLVGGIWATTIAGVIALTQL